ncbi:MAG: hypothetical protein QN178_07825 [Armatimonadota bacterium]|nr:hypothetical protein [Armatimonadota bacterium]
MQRDAHIRIDVDRFWTSEPTRFAPSVIAAVEAAAEELEILRMHMWSGPGHDAKYMAEAGANVLLRAVLRLAGAA